MTGGDHRRGGSTPGGGSTNGTVRPDSTVRLDGAAQAGSPAGRVLLVPGLDGGIRLLSRATPALFGGRRVLPFVHLRDAAEGGLDGLADRALALLDADPDADPDTPTYVCGESFGGTVALTLARRYPERFRGLILLSAFGWYPGPVARLAQVGMRAWDMLGDRLTAPILAAWRPFSVPGSVGLDCPPDLLRAYIRPPELHLPSYRAKCVISLTFDARPWLDEIACPTFVLVGTRDPVVPTSAGRELARRIPDARLHILPGGHLVHIVRAAEAGALVNAWIADHS